MMDRHREGRRVNMAASNGLPRRRHRSSGNSLRDSPEEDGPVEFHDTAAGRLRDRGVAGKKDRDRERNRERDRDRMVVMASNNSGVSRSSKRRRAGEGLSVNNHHQHLHHHGGGHHMAVEDTSDEESLNDEEEDEDEDEDNDGPVRMLPANNTPSSAGFPPPSSSFTYHNNNQNHQNHNHQQNHHNYHHPHRKSFPPHPLAHPTPVPSSAATSVNTVAVTSGNKVFRSVSGTVASTLVASAMAPPPWKAPDEMIGVSVPRKARSVSNKRSHESWALGGGGAVAYDQIHRQEFTTPLMSSGPGAHGLIPSASASPTTDPVSPSSSNASAKKKLKPSGPKQRPPKSSSATKSASSTQNELEIEIEIAEVLYGLQRQPQGPTMGKQETSSPGGSDTPKFDPREVNKSAGDAKSRASSPILNSPSASTITAPSSSFLNTTNSVSSSGVGLGSAPPVSATAPKRKRPRPTVFPVRSSPISSITKVDVDPPSKDETCFPTLEKTPGVVTSVMENGEVPSDSVASQSAHLSSKEPQPDKDNTAALDSTFPLTKEAEGVDSMAVEAKDEPGSPNKESLVSGVKLDEDLESSKANIGKPPVSEVETKRGEKFEIDLMAPPPLRSSPERDREIDSIAVGSMATDVELEVKPLLLKEGDKKVLKIGEQDINLEPEEEKVTATGEVESQKPVVNKEWNNDLQLKLEKTERDGASTSVSGTKQQQHAQKQHQLQPAPNSEKSVAPQTNSLPVPMSLAGWPGALSHMGYMAPLPGVVSMEASNLSSVAIQPPHFLFSQQRPKRCATHCYIAKSIHYHQQFTKMNPFWTSAAGSALQYGTKMSILPPTDFHAGRGVNSGQDKGQALTVFPGHSSKDKNSSTVNSMEAAQRKQISLQQQLHPGASSNILGPAFIFPLSQQPAVAAASVQPGTGKCSPSTGVASSSTSSSSVSNSAAASAVAGATGMSFNYPNMTGNETPYLAFLQNGPYTIPIPAHVGTPPAYRGTHPQPIPLFSGSVYSSQMLHPAQIQQQPPPSQSQGQQGHQIPCTSTASTTSQKHLQNQQQQLHVSGVNGGGGNFHGFPSQNNPSLQSIQFQQRQQTQKPSVTHQATKHDGEGGNEDNRATRLNTNVYGQNFVLPIPPPNFTFLNPVAVSGANAINSNTGDKKQQQPQSQAPNVGVESLPSQAFAMSFAAPINGVATGPGFDISSYAQNPAILQSFPEATKHAYHYMAAAQAHQQKKSYRAPDEGKTGRNDSSKAEEDRKGMAGGKIPPNAQSVAFSRPDNNDASVSSMAGSSVIESSVRALNYGSSSGQSSSSLIASAAGNVSSPGVQQQLQRAQQQQQMIQMQKHNQQLAVPTSGSVRNKASGTSNGNVYSDHMASTSTVAAKFSNAYSAFPQSSVPISSSVLSPQWKNSAKTTISQSHVSSLASNTSALKNLPQQRSRFQQSHTQISFAANPKSTTAPQGQPPTTTDQTPSSPIIVASPTTSISKSASGTSTSTSNKGGHSSTPSSQQVKSSSSLSIQKSSPVAGRNVPSVFGNPHVATSSPSSVGKAQLSQQQFSKIVLPHSQMMYSGHHLQLQAPHPATSTHATPATSAFGLQRHRSEQQHTQGSSASTSASASASSSSGMLSLCHPAMLTNMDTTDPAKASAAAFPYVQLAAAQSSGKPHQLVPPNLYVHTVPAAVHVKQAELKQPAGE